MQKIQFLLSNIKQQHVLSIVLVTIVTNTLYSLWFQVPFVSNALFGTEPVALSTTAYFGMTLFNLLNALVAVIGLSMLIPKKGLTAGFFIGFIVATFFSMNGYLSWYISAPDMLPSAKIITLTYVGLMIFYALPSTLLGYLRKE